MDSPKIRQGAAKRIVTETDAPKPEHAKSKKQPPIDLFENRPLVGRVPKESVYANNPLVKAIFFTLVSSVAVRTEIERLLKNEETVEHINDPDFTAMDAVLFLCQKYKESTEYPKLVELLRQHGAKPKAMADYARRARAELLQAAAQFDFEG